MDGWLASHAFDIGVLLVLSWYAWDGWRRGFLSASLGTVGFAAAMLTAAFGYRYVGEFIASRSRMPQSFADAFGFFVLWATVDILWPLAARRIHRRLPEAW